MQGEGMAFALFVLSLAMIGAGGFAVWTGYDIIQMERGWTFVIAGSVVASGGAVLLGLAAVAGRLGRLRRELLRHAPAVAPVPARIEPSLQIPPPPIPSQAAADSLLEGGPSAAPPLDPALVQGAPEFLMRRRNATSASQAPGAVPSFPVPPPEVERAVERRTAAASEPEENAPFASGDPVVPDVQPGPAREPVAVASPEVAAPQEPPTIVGTYNSGGNRYVMYSDGSIAADTPRGDFKFGSLDELKQFIAAGGEKG
jgi:hypothetical protein